MGHCSYNYVHESHGTPQTSQAARIHSCFFSRRYLSSLLPISTVIFHHQQVVNIVNHCHQQFLRAPSSSSQLVSPFHLKRFDVLKPHPSTIICTNHHQLSAGDHPSLAIHHGSSSSSWIGLIIFYQVINHQYHDHHHS